MIKYPISIAVLDYAPVAATLIGLIYLTKVVRNRTSSLNRNISIIGTAAIFLGGFLKATWKLIMAVEMTDYNWMENALFIGLASGFSLVAFSVWNTKSALIKKDESKKWFIPVFIILLAFSLSIYLSLNDKNWKMPLIALLTISNGCMSYMCFRIGKYSNLGNWSWLFIISFIISLVMAALSRLDQTLIVQWIEESTNTLGTGVFAFASWRLFRLNR